MYRKNINLLIHFTATDQLILFSVGRYLLIKPVSFPQSSNSNFVGVFFFGASMFRTFWIVYLILRICLIM